ncbi:hypothetical protein [Maritalea porphyrae]|uniref:hypothetical protein n=1 Tax=Maritalea porphyrae TaxID=880732 RepID=UPI0022AFA1DD|nr:hypothetical protein [Maritalea porphyrae]MCZ4270719.1 hypothetical protein [Maritalea porphyrae]
MKTTFYVTELAGRDVAGQRNPGVGKPIELTENQAAQPLRQGYIVDEKPSTKPVQKSVTTQIKAKK